MNYIYNFLILTLLVTGCSNDTFDDKGLVLISPSKVELSEYQIAVGDTLLISAVYKGKEQVLYIWYFGKGIMDVPDNAWGDGVEAYSYDSRFSGGELFDVVNNEPFEFVMPILKEWSPSDPKISVRSRTLYVRVVTENHILDYAFSLTID